MAGPPTTDPTDPTAAEPGSEWPAASLSDVTNAAEARDRARAALNDAEDEWRYAVGSAIDGGRDVSDVATAAGTSERSAREIHRGHP